MKPVTVRTRLLLSLALLCIATLLAGAVSWYALSSANARLDTVHSDTLAEVANALALSRQASDLATSAPFLLSLSSPFRVQTDGETALSRLDDMVVIEATVPDTLKARLEPVKTQLREAIASLMAQVTAKTVLSDRILRINAELVIEERRFAALSALEAPNLADQRDRLTVQRLSAVLLAAGRAENLIGLGEYQREIFMSKAGPLPTSAAQLANIASLMQRADGINGLFELRRAELSRQIEAEASLVRIRVATSAITELAAQVTNNARLELARQRTDASSSITVAKSLIVAVVISSALIALLAALFVSGYVTRNLQSISEAMLRLAKGDRSSRLPRGKNSSDEISTLFHSFRTFRANALRLDRSNRQLAQKNALFESMFANINDGVAIVSESGTIIAANANLTRILRLDPAKTTTRLSLVNVLAQSGMKQCEPTTENYREYASGDGIVIEERSSALPDGGAVVMFTDTTERRLVESRLQEIRRIESLGKISGEVAHDFGNILSTISANLHLLETAPKERVPALRQSLNNTLDLGASLTQRLLAFARRQHLEPEFISLNALVEGVADLIGFALRDGQDLHIVPCPENPFVRVDAGQLESALLNLCLNASQAMADVGTIKLTISQSGKTALIEISDQGSGMSPTVLRQAMEPFFTARPDGKGTGLGLSMVYGFMRQSGGDIEITSQPDIGTTVLLTFPLHEVITPAIFKFRALIVEDSPQDLSAAVSAVEASGGTVIACTTYAGAIELIFSDDHFDVLLTDLHLDNDQSGWDIARAALNRRPNLRVLNVSGRLPDINPLDEEFPGRALSQSKPLTAAIFGRFLFG